MLRLLLGTIFLLSSSFPALAEWSCGYCMGGGNAPPRFVAPPYNSFDTQQVFSASATSTAGGVNGVMGLAVIYPGIVVLMTMMAYYFMRVMEPQAGRSHPGFVPSAITLSAVWLVGFTPFLSSALGGFLFCLTAISCTGGWLVTRRFGVQTLLWQRAMIFWSFFFFSLLAGIMITGNGGGLALFFEDLWKNGLGNSRDFGPPVLWAANIAAAYAATRLTGWRAQPLSDDARVKLKICALVVFTLLLDAMASDSHYSIIGWLITSLLLATPSVAYYGAYWLVTRLPEQQRMRAGGILFTLLALFVLMLGCLVSGAAPVQMLLVATSLGLGVAVGASLKMLWHSGCDRAVKIALSSLAALVTLAAGAFAFMLAMLSPLVKVNFACDMLLALPAGLVLAAVLGAVGCGIKFILSRKHTARAKYMVAALMAAALLFWLSAAQYIGSVVMEAWRGI